MEPSSLAAYPLVPWFAVIAPWASASEQNDWRFEPARQAHWWMLHPGLGLTLAFLVIRAINIYGDPNPWSTKIPGMTVLSFLGAAPNIRRPSIFC